MGNEQFPVRELGPIDYLRSKNYSFISPAKMAKKRRPERMLELNHFSWVDPHGRKAKIISSAYYALELSTPLPPLDEAMAALEKLEVEQREDADRIIDRLTIAWTVDGLLEGYYDRFRLTIDNYFGYLSDLRRSTAENTPQNTGVLKALADMSRATGKVETITPIVARASEVLIRAAIAQEKNIKLPEV